MERGKLLRAGASSYPLAFRFVGCLAQPSRARRPVLQASERLLEGIRKTRSGEMEADVENLEESARGLWKSDPR